MKSLHQREFTKKTEYPLAVITGGAKRLGKVFANYFAENGYGIVLHYFNSESEAKLLQKQLLQFHVPVYIVRADLRQDADFEYFFSFIDNLLSGDEISSLKFKVLVNSAAEMKKSNFLELPIKDFDNTFGLNLRAPFICSQYAAKKLDTGGLIINISDIAAQKNWVNYSDYVISKAGLDQLTRILARLLGPKIRVNGIAPGLVYQSSTMNDIEWENLISKMPMKKPITPDDLCKALDFIIHSESVTGQTIVIDSGYSLI